MPVRVTNSVLFTVTMSGGFTWTLLLLDRLWHLSKTLNKGKKLFWSLTYIDRDDKTSSVQVLACKLWACEAMGSGCSLHEAIAIRALGKNQSLPSSPTGPRWSWSRTMFTDPGCGASVQKKPHATILFTVWREQDVRMTPSTLKINSIQCSHHFSYCPTFRPIRQDHLSYFILVTSTTLNTLVLMVVLHEENLM